MKVNFDKYCSLCDIFEASDIICDDGFPSIEDAKRIFSSEQNFREYYNFVVWCLETAPDDVKESEEYIFLSNMFEHNVEMV